jgi:hypothetical protein
LLAFVFHCITLEHKRNKTRRCLTNFASIIPLPFLVKTPDNYYKRIGRKLQRISFIFCACGILGCTTAPQPYWTKPGATEEEFQRDLAAARLQAMQRSVPAQIISIDPHRNTAGGRISDGLSNFGAGVAHARDEDRMIELILQSRGWQKVTPASPAPPSRLTP